VLGSAWVTDGLAVIAGGGGKGRTGVPNRAMLLAYDGRELTEGPHAELEDAAIALCAVPQLESGSDSAVGRTSVLVALEEGGVDVLEATAASASRPASVRVVPDSGHSSGRKSHPLHASQIGTVSCIAASDSGRHVALGHTPPTAGGAAAADRPGGGDDEASVLTVLASGTLRQLGRVDGVLIGELRSCDFCPCALLGGDHEALVATVDGRGQGRVLDWRAGGGEGARALGADLSLSGTPLAGGTVRRAVFSRAATAPTLLAVIIHGGRSHLARFAVARDAATGAMTLAFASSTPVSADIVTALGVERAGGADTASLGTAEGEVIVLTGASGARPHVASRRRGHLGIVTGTTCGVDRDGRGAALTGSIDAFVVVTPLPTADSGGLGVMGGTLAFLVALFVLLLAFLLADGDGLAWGLGLGGLGRGGGE